MANASKILLTSGDAPATPASGTVAMYSKADKKYYIKDDSGTETAMVGVDGVSVCGAIPRFIARTVVFLCPSVASTKYLLSSDLTIGTDV